MTTALQPNELLTEVRFPTMAAEAGWAFHEFARRHGDFAIVEVGALLRLDGGRVSEGRVAVGGAGPIAFRAKRAEDALEGEPLTDAVIEQAAEQAAAMAEPDSDIHASAEYRRHLTKVLTRRALRDARDRAA